MFYLYQVRNKENDPSVLIERLDKERLKIIDEIKRLKKLKNKMSSTSLRHPFSRSYGVILPSSLTMLLPPALGFSPHLPVSVYGTGMYHTIAAFLDSRNHTLRYFCSLRVTYSDCTAVFPAVLLPRLPRYSHSRDVLSFCVPTVLMIHGTGISTCCPSTTPLSLALGPDLPRADQLTQILQNS